ncbi:MAG: tRNA (adenosine(37)-N6)-threonylcarbamoyltransferase complex transferase subunit TsaD, partial [Elusimicrobiota bacterium]
DETAVAVSEKGRIISHKIASQTEIHSLYGGVVPEIASREHLKRINVLLEECLKEAGGWEDIDGIAVAARPGLEGSLLVGLTVARTAAYLSGLPLVEVDHLEAHLFAWPFTQPLDPPGLGLVASGGHTRLVRIKKWGDYEILSSTRDDAVGECFDKVASMLDLNYPGGPEIEKMSAGGNKERFKFPVANLNKSLDFSYSGLKTSVLYKIKYDFKGKLSLKDKKDIAASFQHAALKPLVSNAFKAAAKTKSSWVLVCGGVAANKALRQMMLSEGDKTGIKIVFPHISLCTDNAATVSACGEFHLEKSASGQ